MGCRTDAADAWLYIMQMQRNAMNADESGGMEFLESMIAVMAVAVVLAAFLGMSASLAADHMSDPTEGLDPARLGGEIRDGAFVPGFEDYISGYVESRGLGGAAVTVTVPGGFCEEPERYVTGSQDGPRWSASFVSTVPCDGGRTVPVFFEVVLCGRARTGSSR